MEDSNSIMSSEKVAEAAMKLADAVTSAEKSQLKLQAATNQHLVDMKDALQQIVASTSSTRKENNNNNNKNNFDNQALIKAVEDLTKETKSIKECLESLKEDNRSFSRSIKNLEEDSKIRRIDDAIESLANLHVNPVDMYLVKSAKPRQGGEGYSVYSDSVKSFLIHILTSFRQGRGHCVRHCFLDPLSQGRHTYTRDVINDEWYENFRGVFQEKLHKLLGKEPVFVPEDGMFYYEKPE